jgi:Coenzyme PQQ synthesis protein D (PqqD)
MSDQCYRVNTPEVLYELFDDELVAIHLETGSYHSLFAAAADAFVLIAEEATVPELAEALSRKYAAETDEIERALVEFIAQLQRENLISEVETRRARGPLQIPGDETGLPFVAPTVAAYHELQGLFLIDPIHEVDERGWPHLRPLDDGAATKGA